QLRSVEDSVGRHEEPAEGAGEQAAAGDAGQRRGPQSARRRAAVLHPHRGGCGEHHGGVPRRHPHAEAGRRAAQLTAAAVRLAICFIAALLPAHPASADAPIATAVDALRPEAEAYIVAGMKTFDGPARAIGIVADDRLVYAKGFGVRSKSAGAVVDANTVFQIGSATKGFL